MDESVKAFQRIGQDSEQLLPLIQSLSADWLANLRDDFPERERAQATLPLILRVLAESNVQWTFHYCESPIEHTLVDSLLAIHARMSPLSLVIAPNFLHSPNPAQAFRDVCSDMQKFTGEIKAEDKRPHAFLEHIQACGDEGRV